LCLLIQWKCNFYLEEMLVIESRFMHEEWSVWRYFTKYSSYVLRTLKKKKKKRRKKDNVCIPVCLRNTNIHFPVHRLTLSFCKRFLSSSSRVIFKILFNTFTLTALRFPRGTSHFRFLIKICVLCLSSSSFPRVSPVSLSLALLLYTVKNML
jgi:hypothetical protein